MDRADHGGHKDERQPHADLGEGGWTFVGEPDGVRREQREGGHFAPEAAILLQSLVLEDARQIHASKRVRRSDRELERFCWVS